MQSRHSHEYGLQASRGAASPITTQVPGPLAARFLEETDEGYLVGEPGGDRRAWVPKERATVERFPPRPGRHASGRRLLRWSAWALVGAVCGGAVGVVVGSAVVVLALAQLGRFSRRAQQWGRRQRGSAEILPLPAAATSERFRLLAALGQGLIAMLLGSFVFLLLLGRL
jgi:hypothetical protein